MSLGGVLASPRTQSGQYKQSGVKTKHTHIHTSMHAHTHPHVRIQPAGVQVFFTHTQISSTIKTAAQFPSHTDYVPISPQYSDHYIGY